MRLAPAIGATGLIALSATTVICVPIPLRQSSISVPHRDVFHARRMYGDIEHLATPNVQAGGWIESGISGTRQFLKWGKSFLPSWGGASPEEVIQPLKEVVVNGELAVNEFHTPPGSPLVRPPSPHTEPLGSLHQAAGEVDGVTTPSHDTDGLPNNWATPNAAKPHEIDAETVHDASEESSIHQQPVAPPHSPAVKPSSPAAAELRGSPAGEGGGGVTHGATVSVGYPQRPEPPQHAETKPLQHPPVSNQVVAGASSLPVVAEPVDNRLVSDISKEIAPPPVQPLKLGLTSANVDGSLRENGGSRGLERIPPSIGGVHDPLSGSKVSNAKHVVKPRPQHAELVQPPPPVSDHAIAADIAPARVVGLKKEGGGNGPVAGIGWNPPKPQDVKAPVVEDFGRIVVPIEHMGTRPRTPLNLIPLSPAPDVLHPPAATPFKHEQAKAALEQVSSHIVAPVEELKFRPPPPLNPADAHRTPVGNPASTAGEAIQSPGWWDRAKTFGNRLVSWLTMDGAPLEGDAVDTIRHGGGGKDNVAVKPPSYTPQKPVDPPLHPAPPSSAPPAPHGGAEVPVMAPKAVVPGGGVGGHRGIPVQLENDHKTLIAAAAAGTVGTVVGGVAGGEVGYHVQQRKNDAVLDRKQLQAQTASTSQQKVLSDKGNDVAHIVVANAKEAATIGTQAVVSGAYLYPIEGIYYLGRHPKLWKPLQRPLLLGVLTSFVVTSFMFFFTYLPQVAILTLSNGPLSFFTAIPLVLGESATITLFVARMLWLAPALDNTFDAVLLQQGHAALVAEGREIQGSGNSKRIGKALSAPLNRFSKQGKTFLWILVLKNPFATEFELTGFTLFYGTAIITYLMSLPLNAIPLVGTIFFLFYNGYKTGPNQHTRYFQLKHFTQAQKARHISQNRGSYTAMGTAAMALNLVPGMSIIFAFTTATGAALWASDLEKKAGATVDTNASADATQDLSNVAKKIEPDHQKLL
ncbi:hypothetical protein FRB96_006988 [Tulasnella sp. 330]|nr:hypothetical protein FRB96_006988 [Tulasnella sp. 330]